jgi:hypothetical protein
MSYLTSASLNTLLKKEIGYSFPVACFYNKTDSTLSKEANEKIRKSLE